jgi:NAD(P)-dependent dehydrogenase (short-subunit alcohol dehydrogenase family)
MNGKVALVTGAGAGIGRETAMLFAQKKAKVLVADTNPKAAEETVNIIRASGGEASYV